MISVFARHQSNLTTPTPTPTLTPTETVTPTPSVTPTITPTTTPTVTETPSITPTPTTSPISSGNVQMDFYNDLSATTVTNIFINVVNYSSGIFPMSPGESGIITGITQTSYGEVGLQINYNFGSEGTAKYIYVYVDGSLDRTTSTFYGITFNIGTTIPVQNNSVITVRQYNNPLSPTETPTPTPTNSLTPTFTPTVTLTATPTPTVTLTPTLEFRTPVFESYQRTQETTYNVAIVPNVCDSNIGNRLIVAQQQMFINGEHRMKYYDIDNNFDFDYDYDISLGLTQNNTIWGKYFYDDIHNLLLFCGYGTSPYYGIVIVKFDLSSPQLTRTVKTSGFTSPGGSLASDAWSIDKTNGTVFFSNANSPTTYWVIDYLNMTELGGGQVLNNGSNAQVSNNIFNPNNNLYYAFSTQGKAWKTYSSTGGTQTSTSFTYMSDPNQVTGTYENGMYGTLDTLNNRYYYFSRITFQGNMTYISYMDMNTNTFGGRLFTFNTAHVNISLHYDEYNNYLWVIYGALDGTDNAPAQVKCYNSTTLALVDEYQITSFGYVLGVDPHRGYLYIGHSNDLTVGNDPDLTVLSIPNMVTSTPLPTCATPTPTPTPTNSLTPTFTPTLTPTETVTPTPTPTNSLTPTFTPTVTPTETTSVTNITLSFNYSLGSGSVSWCNETLSELSQSTCDAVAASYQVQSYYGTSISVGTQFLGSQALSQCWVTNSNYPFSTVWTSGSTEYIIETDNTGVVTRYDSFVVCDNVNVTPTLTPTFTPTLTMTPTITQTSTPTPTITPSQLILNQDYILMADASSSNYLFDESNNNVTNGGKVTTMIDANGRNYSASVRVGLSTGDKPVWNSNIFNGKGGITFQSGILDDGFNFTTATFTPLGNTFASVSVLKIDSSLSSDYGQVFNFAQGYGSDRNYFYGSLFFSQSGLAWAWGGSLNSIGNAISYLLISPDFSPYEPHTYLLYSTSSGVDLYIDGAYIKTVSSSPSFGVSDFGFSRNLTLTTLRPEFTFFEYSLVSGTTVNNTNQQTFINTYQEKYRTYNLSGFNLISAFLPKNYNPSSPSTLNATTFSSSPYQSSTSLTLTGITTTSGAGNDQYLVLDGTTSRIVIGGAPISNILTVGGTMTFTFKLNNLNKNQIIYSTYHSGGDTSYIKVNTNNQLEFYILKSGNTVNSFTGTTVLSSETTYIVQLVSINDIFTLLLDGVSVGSTSYSQNISIFEHNIGARYDAQTSLYTDFLDGSLGVMLFDSNDFSETPRSQNRLAIKYRYNLH
jgi:hypothetical protein